MWHQTFHNEIPTLSDADSSASVPAAAVPVHAASVQPVTRFHSFHSLSHHRRHDFQRIFYKLNSDKQSTNSQYSFLMRCTVAAIVLCKQESFIDVKNVRESAGFPR